MKTIRLNVTTGTDGAGVSDLVPVPGGGLLYSVQCVDGDFADGVDVTITDERGDMSVTLFVVENFNTDIVYYPRALENLNTDGTALTTHTHLLVRGQVKATVASGGSVKTGAFILDLIEA